MIAGTITVDTPQIEGGKELSSLPLFLVNIERATDHKNHNTSESSNLGSSFHLSHGLLTQESGEFRLQQSIVVVFPAIDHIH